MRLMRDLVGETLSGRYRMVARIAGGGMGDVYRGHDLLLDRAVAVKVLQPSLAADPELVDRFRLEARAAARLTHPNVVGVYDWGEEPDGTPYMVMEYVPGTDLRDVLVARGALEPAQACEVVASVCEALAAAHAEGLIHRDIKPENILLARGGQVKVADFGIALFGDAERTEGTTIAGTLRYLAPEQARGEEAVAASDVWAAGALLFECLTGRPPSQGAGGDLLQKRAVEEPVEPSRLEPLLPPDLDDVVLRACALDPAARYAGAADMAADLRRVAVRSLPDAASVRSLLEDVTVEIRLPDMEPTVAGPQQKARRRKRSRAPRLVAIVALVALLLAGGVRAGAALLGPREVVVPSVAGMTLEEARRAADEVNLVVEVVGRERSRSVERGGIISQDPATGVLIEGEAIAVILSKGPPLVRVPAVAGRDVADAMAALEAARLVVGERSEEWSVEHEAGTVIRATIRGRVTEGTTVGLVVSRGPRSLEIPDVAGLPADKAAARLERAGFEPVRTDVYSDDVPVGRVVSTDPAAGLEADEASSVTIYVSIGPEFEEITLPDVRGMDVERAKKRLTSLGLRVQVVVSCEGGTTVVETDPRASSTVRENDRIALFVC